MDADWLDIALQVKAPSPDGLGLHGSGLFIVNPPYGLAEETARLTAMFKALR